MSNIPPLTPWQQYVVDMKDKYLIVRGGKLSGKTYACLCAVAKSITENENYTCLFWSFPQSQMVAADRLRSILLSHFDLNPEDIYYASNPLQLRLLANNSRVIFYGGNLQMLEGLSCSRLIADFNEPATLDPIGHWSCEDGAIMTLDDRWTVIDVEIPSTDDD